ncbi:Mut7-C RNAse domain-containing protein [Marinigracilibium pacificum]|uniref:Twitching motility protein PilT n=1 Tax=Marinigracilibium pacificum TaxID=2729599 RepID=A0A848ISH9_9BACT|nr:Mut7-C RNAse domain-containing protein [Marinigracilibium pacificum]NMM47403.1 twitching motility protein PilT [Marinigracilibium pacificum]
MKKVFTFRFYSILNDFLHDNQKQADFDFAFKTPTTIRECLMAFRIPIYEIGKILLNNNDAFLNEELSEGDRISVFPHFRNIINVNGDKAPNFILDSHLGKLAKYLRMLGFDTLYKNNFKDEEIRNIASHENRFVLTRDKLLKNTPDPNYYFVRSIKKHNQLIEIVNLLDLRKYFNPFTRCMTCNEELIRIEKDLIINKIDEGIAQHFNEFYLCKECDKVFWKGTHFMRMEKLIMDLISQKS